MTPTVRGQCASREILKVFPVKPQSLSKKKLLLKRSRVCGLQLRTVTSISTSDSIASPRVCSSRLGVPLADERGSQLGWLRWNRKRPSFCGRILRWECCFVGGIQTNSKVEEE